MGASSPIGAQACPVPSVSSPREAGSFKSRSRCLTEQRRRCHRSARRLRRNPRLSRSRRPRAERHRLPHQAGEYEAIHVAQGELISCVPHVLRPLEDWVPLSSAAGYGNQKNGRSCSGLLRAHDLHCLPWCGSGKATAALLPPCFRPPGARRIDEQEVGAVVVGGRDLRRLVARGYGGSCGFLRGLPQLVHGRVLQRRTARCLRGRSSVRELVPGLLRLLVLVGG